MEAMQDRKVLVVCNLKAAKIVGFSSNGMVLAAKVRRGRMRFVVICKCIWISQVDTNCSFVFICLFQSEDGTKVELIDPPSDAVVGERVFIENLTGEPFSSSQVKKKKTWDKVVKNLKAGEGGTATWDGKSIQTKSGVCRAASLVGAPIS